MKTFKEVIREQSQICDAFLKRIEEIESQNPNLRSADQYRLELPGSFVDLLAVSDLDAMQQADRYLHLQRIPFTGLKLFRFVKEPMESPNPMIEVHEFRTRDKWTRNLNILWEHSLKKEA